MVTRRPSRWTCLALVLVYGCALVPEVHAASLAEMGEWLQGVPQRFVRRLVPAKKKIENPEELQAIFDEVKAETFNDNESQRDEKSNVTRPLKQVGLAVMDGQIGMVRQFLSFQAVQLVKTAATSSTSWQTAGQVVGKMTEATSSLLNNTVSQSGFGRKLFAGMAAGGGASFRQTLASESNFALMALVTVLINSGIYDGLDVDTMKDHVIAVAPLVTCSSYSKEIPATILQGFVSRQLYAGFNGAFERIYASAVSSKSAWGQALAALDDSAERLGDSLFKASRDGKVMASGESMAQKLGLVGVGEGAKFTLGGLCQRLAVAGAFALGGQFVVDATGRIVRGFSNEAMVGGNRNRYYVRQDLNGHQYQKSGNKLQDWLRIRQILLRDMIQNYAKYPVKSLTVPFSGMMGGYLGSIVAGALFAGGGLPVLIGGTLVSTLFAGVGSFVGGWLATKLDRSEFVLGIRKKSYVRRITAEIHEMPCYREGRLTDADVATLAADRADDFDKIERVGQNSLRILIVDDPANIRLVRRDPYLKMVIDDEHGSEHDKNADIRYDVIDLAGERHVFDIGSGRMIHVGKVADNNGRDIVFVNGQGVRVENDVIVNSPPPDRTLHVFDNGIILENRGPDEGWIVRGQGADRDVFFRDLGNRFAFSDGLFRRARGPGDIVAAAPAGADPLAPFVDAVAQASDDELPGLLRGKASAFLDSVRAQAFSSIDGMSDPGAAHERLSEVAGRLGLSDDGAQDRASSFLVEDADNFRNVLKARVGRLLEQAADEVDGALAEADGAELRAGLQRARTSYAVAAGDARHESIGARLRDLPVWGWLSLTGDAEAVTAASLTGLSR